MLLKKVPSIKFYTPNASHLWIKSHCLGWTMFNICDLTCPIKICSINWVCALIWRLFTVEFRYFMGQGVLFHNTPGKTWTVHFPSLVQLLAIHCLRCATSKQHGCKQWRSLTDGANSQTGLCLCRTKQLHVWLGSNSMSWRTLNYITSIEGSVMEKVDY